VSRADKRALKAARKAAKRKRRGGFIFGALIGAGAGLLLAPKSGKEMRRQLLGDGGVGSQVDRVKKAVGAGRESAADQSEELRQKIEETRERLRSQAGGDDTGAQSADTQSFS
jgi:gas vesicle protein